jgi:hypothetical protein
MVKLLSARSPWQWQPFNLDCVRRGDKRCKPWQCELPPAGHRQRQGMPELPPTRDGRGRAGPAARVLDDKMTAAGHRYVSGRYRNKTE